MSDRDEYPSSDLGRESEVQVDIEVPEAMDGYRLDRAVALLTGLTRRAVNELLARESVCIDGVQVIDRSRALRPGQHLEVSGSPTVPQGVRADPTVQFGLVYEDSHVVVVDKPAGLVVHHGSGNHSGTLVDGLVHRFPDLERLGESGVCDPARPGIVHRLDKGTSGLLVIARTELAYRTLVEQLSDRRAGRSYVALLQGALPDEQGVVDAPIGRSARNPTKMTVSSTGKPARTAYKVLDRFDSPEDLTLVEAKLESGRTHQIRVHMSALGCPVLGDDRYGRRSPMLAPFLPALVEGRFFLHARRLSFEHPITGPMNWESPLPADLVSVLEMLEAEARL